MMNSSKDGSPQRPMETPPQTAPQTARKRTTLPHPNDWEHYAAATAAARAVVSRHAPLAHQTGIPSAQLISDLVSWLWERRNKFDPARGKIPTWATKKCWGRLVDLARSAGTAKAKKFVSVASPPDTEKDEKSELSASHEIDPQNALAVLGAIARVVAERKLRGKIVYRKHLRHTRPQILACLVVGFDRRDSQRGLAMRLRASSSLRDAIGIKKDGCPSDSVFHRAAHSRWATPKRIEEIHARAVALRAQVDEQ